MWTRRQEHRIICDSMNSRIMKKRMLANQKCLLKVKSKTETGPFSRRCFSTPSPPVGIFLFCHATLQQSIAMRPWVMERLAVNCFELFESLSFKTVDEVKIGSKTTGEVRRSTASSSLNIGSKKN